MTILHPISSVTVGRLAAAVINSGSWIHLNRVEARETISRMEKAAIAGPGIDSLEACKLADDAEQIMRLATTAYEAGELAYDGRDLSWLWDPAQMDAIHRSSYVY